MMRPLSPFEAGYHRWPNPETECPPAGETAEGRCIDLKAGAPASYPESPDGYKPFAPADQAASVRGARTFPQQITRARANSPQIGSVAAHEAQACLTPTHVTYLAPDGRKWAYRGKRARVMAMLTHADNGITQWDTLPWHTRLGGTIHAMRRDGLDISTQIEGDYRHARYRLTTPGILTVAGQGLSMPAQGGAV